MKAPEVHAVETNVGNVIVGLLAGDSDNPGVTEDLTDVVVYNDVGEVVHTYPRYGDVPIVDGDGYRVLTGTERGYWVTEWASDAESNLADTVDRLTNDLRVAEDALAAYRELLSTAVVDPNGNTSYA